MQCQNCHSQEATHHLQVNINGSKNEMRLCAACAKEMGMYESFGGAIGPLLSGMTDWTPAAVRPKADNRCPGCGLPMSAIAQSGRVGCAACYTHFKSQLTPHIARLHGQNQHKGRVPRRLRQQIEENAKLAQLKSRLQEAVAGEAYEEAARLRDEIRAWEETNHGQ